MIDLTASKRTLWRKPVFKKRYFQAGVALIAIAGCAASPAWAQSFDAVPVGLPGSINYSTGPNTTNLTFFSTVNVIDWRPNDVTGSGTILFQPAGTTATFQTGSVFGDFVVLNRILPVDAMGLPVLNRPIQFNGTINSQFSSGIRGGTVLFYTPGGIILGTNSVFNVGSLVLSTSNINSTGLFSGNNGTLNFLGTPTPNSAIIINPGAQINALVDRSSYVAMVAPRIVQGGTVRVNGSVAYVAAEAATLSVNLGLFNITVETGTGDANGIVHQATGTTTGPATTGPNDPQRIFMMAVPKNAALTMLLGGTIGYPVAAAIAEEGGAVVLSAGFDIAGGEPAGLSVGNAFAANIQHVGIVDTGGEILISANGNATMDGLRASDRVIANTVGAIGFNSITSGTTTNLQAGTAIIGGDINAGDDVITASQTGSTLGNVVSGTGVFAKNDIGALTTGNITAVANIALVNNGVGPITTNTLTAGGDVYVNGGGDVTVTNAIANGTYSDPNSLASIGTVSVIAGGNANLASANAATLIGVRAANIQSTGTLTAGEDIYLEATGTTSVASASAGDDIDIVSPGGIVLTSGISRGDARDDRQVVFNPGNPLSPPVPPSFVLNPAAADGSDIRLTATGGNVTGAGLNAGDDVLINASGAANFTGLLQTRGVGITGGTSNTQITSGSASVGSGASFTNTLITTTGAATVTGAVVAGNTIAINAGTDLTGGGSLNAVSQVDITTGRIIQIGNVTAGTSVIANADIANPAANLTMGAVAAGSFVELRSGGSALTGNITAATDAVVNAFNGNNITVGDVTAGDDIWLSAFGTNAAATLTSGILRSTGLGNDAAITAPATFGSAGPTGNVIRVRGDGSIALGAVNTPGRAILVSDLGAIAAGPVSAPEAIIALARGNISLGGAATTGRFFVADSAMFPNLLPSYDPASLSGLTPIRTAGGLTITGPISANDVSITVGGNSNIAGVSSATGLLVDASGNASFGNAAANLITVIAGQDAIFNGTASAATTIDIRANRQAAFNGIVRAPVINMRSGDIAIGTTGQLGVIGTTQTVNVLNSAGVQMTLGGTGVGAGYTLSSAEAARIFANDIAVNWTNLVATTGVASSAPSTQPSVTVDALTLTSRASNVAGNLAANGSFAITTPGDIRVTGIVALAGAGASNTLRLTGGQNLQIIAGQGSIRISDAANGLAGNVTLAGQNIVAASPAAATAIAGQSSLAAITTRLGQNDGIPVNAALLSANTVNLNGINNVLVQNTGATTLFRDRRGISANVLNIRLNNPNGQIAINGQITGPIGFATGLSAIPLLSINGTPSQIATGFSPASTMNGCQITAIAACRQQENPISVNGDSINTPIDGQAINTKFPTTLIQYKDFETFGYPPLLDEPVTGSGNDDLWPVICDKYDKSCSQ